MSQTVSLPEGTTLKPHGLSSFPPLHNITHKISKMFLHTGIPNYLKKTIYYSLLKSFEILSVDAEIPNDPLILKNLSLGSKHLVLPSRM